MAYGVIVQDKVAAQNVDAYVRPVKSASALENGFVFRLETLSSTSGETEVWVATAPATAAPGLTHLWMLAEPEVVLTASKYKGLDPDPRNFILPIGEIGTAVKIQIGDIVTFSEDGLTGTKSTNTFVNATNADFQLTWGATQTASVVSFRLMETKTLSIGLGSIGTQRITAYKMECLALA